jgi:predicted DNA-binding protein
MYCIVLCFKLLREVFLANTKVARTIYINSDQVEALKKLSDRTKVPQAVYVREALDMLLDKYSEQLKLEFKDSFKERAIQKDLGF